MSGPRRPKDLDDYTSAEEAAAGLEAVARDIREHAEGSPLVKWDIRIRCWNPAWERAPKSKKSIPEAGER
jgi:hypothetical protein